MFLLFKMSSFNQKCLRSTNTGNYSELTKIMSKNFSSFLIFPIDQLLDGFTKIIILNLE